MKPPEVVRRELVSQWIDKAEEDLDAALFLLERGDRFRTVIGFHCQQAAEKYIKALLISYQVDFAKTHDLEKLLRLLRQHEPDVSTVLGGVVWLTPFGVDVRYPGDIPDMLPGDEERAVELAKLVRRVVRAKIEAAGK